MGVWEQAEDPAYLGRMLSHPSRAAVERTLADLIAGIRATSSRDDLRDVQADLVGWLAEAERRYTDANVAMKRRGAKQDWDVDFWRRSVAHFRVVGDALAWRFFDFRRQWIILLGRNEHPGMMMSKAGTRGEMAVVDEHWANGRPALLTAATHCVTIGDVCVDIGDGIVEVVEVKPPGRGPTPAQRRRAEQVIRQINVDPRIETDADPTYIIEADENLTSYWADAKPAINRATEVGVSRWSPARGVAVRFSSVPGAMRVGQGAYKAEFEAVDPAIAAAFEGTTHRIRTNTATLGLGRRAVVPLSILPIEPADAAGLITGSLAYVCEISVDTIVESLEEAGAQAEIALSGEPAALLPDTPIVRWRDGADSGTINAAAITQIGIELMPVDLAARAIVDRRQRGPERRTNTYVCFRNERAVWA